MGVTNDSSDCQSSVLALPPASGAFVLGLLALLVILPSSPLTRHLCLLAPSWALLAALASAHRYAQGVTRLRFASASLLPRKGDVSSLEAESLKRPPQPALD